MVEQGAVSRLSVYHFGYQVFRSKTSYPKQAQSLASHGRCWNQCCFLAACGYTRLAYRRKLKYGLDMKAVFIELPPFERHRASYLDDDDFRSLQNLLMLQPEAGDLIPGTGGLRKLRFGDARRGKGKRGGLRVIYYWWDTGSQIWLFTVYNKDEMADLTPLQRKALKEMIKQELEARRKR